MTDYKVILNPLEKVKTQLRLSLVDIQRNHGGDGMHWLRNITPEEIYAIFIAGPSSDTRDTYTPEQAREMIDTAKQHENELLEFLRECLGELALTTPAGRLEAIKQIIIGSITDTCQLQGRNRLVADLSTPESLEYFVDTLITATGAKSGHGHCVTCRSVMEDIVDSLRQHRSELINFTRKCCDLFTTF